MFLTVLMAGTETGPSQGYVQYRLDDGAWTIKDSVAMVRMAAEHGTMDLVLAPHDNPNFPFRSADWARTAGGGLAGVGQRPGLPSSPVATIR